MAEVTGGISKLQALGILRREVRPIEELEGGDCEIWLIRWPTQSSKTWFWVEARSSGCAPLGGPYRSLEEAQQCRPEVTFTEE